MTARRRKPDDTTTLAPRLSFQAAEAFHLHALQFVNRIEAGMEDPSEVAARDMGSMIASATNLFLALELYVKTLQVLAGGAPRGGHDLAHLFAALPELVRLRINIGYRERLASKAETSMRSLEVAFWIGNKPDSGPGDTSKELDRTLPSLLRRNRYAYQTWRYLYERGVDGDYRLFVYEFSDLSILADALRAVILDDRPAWRTVAVRSV